MRIMSLPVVLNVGLIRLLAVPSMVLKLKVEKLSEFVGEIMNSFEGEHIPRPPMHFTVTASNGRKFVRRQRPVNFDYE